MFNHSDIRPEGSDRSNPLEIAIFSASVASTARIRTREGSTGRKRKARMSLSRLAPPLVATEMASDKVAFARENKPCDQLTYWI